VTPTIVTQADAALIAAQSARRDERSRIVTVLRRLADSLDAAAKDYHAKRDDRRALNRLVERDGVLIAIAAVEKEGGQ
jgi:hypothetical protein